MSSWGCARESRVGSGENATERRTNADKGGDSSLLHGDGCQVLDMPKCRFSHLGQKRLGKTLLFSCFAKKTLRLKVTNIFFVIILVGILTFFSADTVNTNALERSKSPCLHVESGKFVTFAK